MGGAAFLAGVGAFGTAQAAPWTLYSYWGVVMSAGALLFTLVLDAFERRRLLADRPAEKAAILAVSVSLLTTPIVWVAAGLALNGSLHPSRLIHLLPQVLLVAVAFVALQLMVEGRARAMREAQPKKGRPKLIHRLPDRLREAEVRAVEAEDHYLRVHTDRGSALILMRLSDAVVELEGIEGARTHRSWWVARDAVIGADRGGGRATLKLKGGLQAPASRSYARELRLAGWF